MENGRGLTTRNDGEQPAPPPVQYTAVVWALLAAFSLGLSSFLIGLTSYDDVQDFGHSSPKVLTSWLYTKRFSVELLDVSTTTHTTLTTSDFIENIKTVEPYTLLNELTNHTFSRKGLGETLPPESNFNSSSTFWYRFIWDLSLIWLTNGFAGLIGGAYLWGRFGRILLLSPSLDVVIPPLESRSALGKLSSFYHNHIIRRGARLFGSSRADASTMESRRLFTTEEGSVKEESIRGAREGKTAETVDEIEAVEGVTVDICEHENGMIFVDGHRGAIRALDDKETERYMKSFREPRIKFDYETKTKSVRDLVRMQEEIPSYGVNTLTHPAADESVDCLARIESYPPQEADIATAPYLHEHLLFYPQVASDEQDEDGEGYEDDEDGDGEGDEDGEDECLNDTDDSVFYSNDCSIGIEPQSQTLIRQPEDLGALSMETFVGQTQSEVIPANTFAVQFLSWMAPVLAGLSLTASQAALKTGFWCPTDQWAAITALSGCDGVIVSLIFVFWFGIWPTRTESVLLITMFFGACLLMLLGISAVNLDGLVCGILSATFLAISVAFTRTGALLGISGITGFVGRNLTSGSCGLLGMAAMIVIPDSRHYVIDTIRTSVGRDCLRFLGVPITAGLCGALSTAALNIALGYPQSSGLSELLPLHSIVVTLLCFAFFGTLPRVSLWAALMFIWISSLLLPFSEVPQFSQAIPLLAAADAPYSSSRSPIYQPGSELQTLNSRHFCPYSFHH